MSNVSQVQKQIKAFNKKLARWDMSKAADMEYYAYISDLIDYERTTKSGYAKAGLKYLEKMTPEELLAYSSDIQYASQLIEVSKWEFKINARDPASFLWQFQQELIDIGMPYDSDQIRDVIWGKVDIDYKDLAVQMLKYRDDKNYGLSDASKWFKEQTGLEV